jgi:hypothetical protein
LEKGQKKRSIFDGLVERIWGSSINPPRPNPEDEVYDKYQEYEDDNEVARKCPDFEDSVGANGRLLN